jgi:branched-chain amino acid transport system substrate-binding protein
LGLSLLAGPALAQGTYKIGEINSYKAQPAFLEPYKKGMELAVEQVNAAAALPARSCSWSCATTTPTPAMPCAPPRSCYTREKVDVLTGSFLSHVGLALTDFAQPKRFFLAAEPLTDKIVWETATATPTACAPPPTCRWPCWCPRPPS